jgi:hypothetical protein
VSEPEFQPERMFQVHEAHEDRFVLIGGFAAVIHGSPYVTTDIDVVPKGDGENLGRLSDALKAMHARVWTASEPGGIPFDHGAASLGEVLVWNLVTDFGRLDVTLEPAGTTGYEDLESGAIDLEILGAHVEVASLADVVRSKEAAGRDKDRLVLPVLRRLLRADAERDPSDRPRL